MIPLMGQTLNSLYRIDKHIGRGGMAEVYKVLDLQRNTYLAMKVLREDFSEDKVFLRRFRREAQTLAEFQHGNIWEWVADLYDSQYYRHCPKINPRGPMTGLGRVIPGGCWMDNWKDVITVVRNWSSPHAFSSYIGFFCAANNLPE
jgi:serine/threonine protein kinase